MSLNLFLDQIQDPIARENFRKLQELLTDVTFLQGDFVHREISVSGAVTDFKFPHNLGYTPKDILVTSVIGSGAITWKYEQFDATNLVFSTTGAVTVRLFVGSYG